MCEYQDPANYVLDILNKNGQVISSTRLKRAPRDNNTDIMIMEVFITGINASQIYMFGVMIANHNFTRQILLNISDIGEYVTMVETRFQIFESL